MPTPHLTANGKQIPTTFPCTIETFLLSQKLLPKSVVVEHNGEAVAPSEFSTRPLQPGDRLPLIREVVEDLAINPNTVAKAYRQMEQENLVTGRPGQGTFVNEQQSAAMSASTYTSLRRGLATWLRRAYAAGLDEQAVNALFASVHQQTRNEDVA